MNLETLNNLPWPVFVLMAVWDLVWKGFGLWRAAKNNQRNWFIAILAINTVGILPMIYLKFFQKRQV